MAEGPCFYAFLNSEGSLSDVLGTRELIDGTAEHSLVLDFLQKESRNLLAEQEVAAVHFSSYGPWEANQGMQLSVSSDQRQERRLRRSARIGYSNLLCPAGQAQLPVHMRSASFEHNDLPEILPLRCHRASGRLARLKGFASVELPPFKTDRHRDREGGESCS